MTRIIVLGCFIALISLISQFELAYRKAPSGPLSVDMHKFVCHLNEISSSMISLPRAASVISLLLLLSGDIELNPGPETVLGKIYLVMLQGCMSRVSYCSKSHSV